MVHAEGAKQAQRRGRKLFCDLCEVFTLRPLREMNWREYAI